MKKILIVEDSKEISVVLREVLAGRGYAVEIDEVGNTIFQKLNSPPDLIIMDVILKGVNGSDLCLQVKQKKKIPVILMSAHPEEKTKQLAQKCHADDYIAKPFNINTVINKVEKLL